MDFFLCGKFRFGKFSHAGNSKLGFFFVMREIEICDFLYRKFKFSFFSAKIQNSGFTRQNSKFSKIGRLVIL